MKIHALQTGFVRIKTAQVEGRGHGWPRRLAIFTDRNWTAWLPTYAWVIDHPEGIAVVDTGQGAHLLESGKSLHPYVRWEVTFRIEREQEIGPQLRGLGIGPRDVKRVILTHLHMDHDGGLAHFPNSAIPCCARRIADCKRGISAACAAICRTGGRPGSIQSRSTWQPSRFAPLPPAGD